ncbi:unnamed protein product [Prunus armeniaca]|uniref:Carboxypeptidase A inhibitor-like domain-containing protein n=1 Tax=Prunus armeniaca TaxID=36596 RepID=A0A6J5UUC4_PRUAR|nr:hypothetical protein GBA52_016986 [Prunus armeniaca]CAB4280249.1 unnamed protein product [Prunus armeniaca]
MASFKLQHLLAVLLIFLHLSFHSIADPHGMSLSSSLERCPLCARECEAAWDCGSVCRDMGILSPNAV